MYRQARFYIRTALAYLLLAFVVAALLFINQAWPMDGRIGALTPVFYHLLMVGWITQLIGGVALWLFPPLNREQPRGNEALSWIAYGALNAGLICRVIGEPWLVWDTSLFPKLLMVASAVMQVLAVWLLVAQLWPRIKRHITTPKAKGVA